MENILIHFYRMKLSTLFFSLTCLLIRVCASAQKVDTIALSNMGFNDKFMLNRPVPAFTLRDLQNKPVSIGDYKGKVVVLDFWATWCLPCLKSFPYMQRT